MIVQLGIIHTYEYLDVFYVRAAGSSVHAYVDKSLVPDHGNGVTYITDT